MEHKPTPEEVRKMIVWFDLFHIGGPSHRGDVDDCDMYIDITVDDCWKLERIAAMLRDYAECLEAALPKDDAQGSITVRVVPYNLRSPGEP